VSDYRPIACAAHERLEFAALTRQRLLIRVEGESLRVLPLDIYAREGTEWMLAETASGERLTLRLDRFELEAAPPLG
jgi:Rho-binding antiterminator